MPRLVNNIHLLIKLRDAVGSQEVEKRMDRLANGGNLTPEERKARHALAVLAKVIDDNVKTPEVAPLPVAKARK